MLYFEIKLPRDLHQNGGKQAKNISFELGSNDYWINGVKAPLSKGEKGLLTDMEGYKFNIMKKNVLVSIFQKEDVLEY